MLKRGDPIFVLRKKDKEVLGKYWGFPTEYIGSRINEKGELEHTGYYAGHFILVFNSSENYVIRKKPNITTGQYFNCEVKDLVLEKLE